VFVLIVVLLIAGNLVYQVARLGYLQRQREHRPVPRAQLEAIHDAPAPQLTVLIPSFKEEQHVLLQTLLSAALMEYPERRVVVLFDDPPRAPVAELAALKASRAMVGKIGAAFAAKARSFEDRALGFVARLTSGKANPSEERVHVAQLYGELAGWLDEMARDLASSEAVSAHTDRWFVEHIVRAPAREHRSRAQHLRSQEFELDELAHEYRRLVALVTVEITSFERKQYVNLSHAPNKAMNLNSYIGLMGRCFREVDQQDGLHLVEYAADEATLLVPSADYILTVDADSIVLPDYALRLIPVMERDPRIAVAQTPYSSFPGAACLLERVAGATTDIQYMIHQGFTRFNATYWVGANALLRYTALRDIRGFTNERGYHLPVFIQDRTVIEDTGSTVDLISRGWRLYNYPERLAYSATPPDFGALIIQRRRWSNGGLIILPNLIRHARKLKNAMRAFPELALRTHYLVSPAAGNLGLLILFILLIYHFDERLSSLWLPLAAAPYYFLYGRDLRNVGYQWRDLFRVYALNLLLVPVNLAGVLRSLQQAFTGNKAAFGRTPKVQSRTPTTPVHVLFQWGLLAYLSAAFVIDMLGSRYSYASFAFINAAICCYGITVYLGWKMSYDDLRRGVKNSRSRQSIAGKSASSKPLPAKYLGSVYASDERLVRAPCPKRPSGTVGTSGLVLSVPAGRALGTEIRTLGKSNLGQ